MILRPLLNVETLAAWAVAAGFNDLVPAAWHITVARGTTVVKLDQRVLHLPASQGRFVCRMDEFIVLEVTSLALTRRHAALLAQGATWPHRSFRPHVTLTPDQGQKLDDVVPYEGELILGPEVAGLKALLN